MQRRLSGRLGTSVDGMCVHIIGPGGLQQSGGCARACDGDRDDWSRMGKSSERVWPVPGAGWWAGGLQRALFPWQAWQARLGAGPPVSGQHGWIQHSQQDGRRVDSEEKTFHPTSARPGSQERMHHKRILTDRELR